MAIVGVGLDVVEVSRAQELLDRKGPQVIERVLTDEERAYVTAVGDPAQALAARLAAKEAVYKALQSFPGARGVGWREIGVHRRDDGRPEARLSGKAAELVAQHRVTVHLSLSHSRDVAAAVAIIER
jgi:holo-[acyl-carrier protein] synthase